MRAWMVVLLLLMSTGMTMDSEAQTLLDNYDGVGGLTYTTEYVGAQYWETTGGRYEAKTGGVTTPEHSYASYDLTLSIPGWRLYRTEGNRWFGWMDLNRTIVSGWGASSYSCGMVLSANSSDFNATTTKGYAVGFKNAGDSLVIFRFDGGIISGTTNLPGTSTQIVNSGYKYVDGHNGVNFYVELLNDGRWKIYYKSGAQLSDALATDKTNYNDGNATSAAADETYTGDAFKYAGWIYAHGLSGTAKAFFDNFGAGQVGAPLPDSGNVVINEIMYNPCTSQGDDANFEWIELWNLENDTMNISEWTVSDGAGTFTIPANTFLAPGDFLLLAKDTNAVKGESQYSDNLGSDAILLGNFTFSLVNTGDEVVVKNKAGKLIDSLTYDDALPWPTSPNGNGPSLDLYNPGLDNRQAASWRGAVETYGTPGDTNSTFLWVANTGSWYLSTTWSPEGVPTPNYGVEIPSANTVTISAVGGNVYCRDLIIKGTLTHSSSAGDTLFVYGDWKNDGTFNRGTGTVTFKGGSRKEIDKKTGAAGRERFHNLVIELSSINDTIMAESQTTNSPFHYDSIWAANFTIKRGTYIQQQRPVKVDNNFTLSGGRYVMSGNKGEIDVAGDVVISSEFIFEQPDAAILCAGNLSISGANTFTSHKGRVLMNGSIDHNTLSMSGSGNFFNFLKIEATNNTDNLTDSVVALTDITANRLSILWGVYSPDGYKTTVTDTALFVGTRGTLRMKPGDTLDLKRGLWLNRGDTYQANTEISGGVILCDGMFKDSTDAGFQPSGGKVRFVGTTNSDIKLGAGSYFNNIVIDKATVEDSVMLSTDIAVRGEFFKLENGTFFHNNRRVTFNRGGLLTTTVTGSPQFHSLTIDSTILDVDSTDITSYITVTHDTTFLRWGAIQKIQHKRVDNNADTIFYDGLGRAALRFTPTDGSMDSVRVHSRFGSMIPANAFSSGCAAGISSPTRYYNISPKNPGTATVKMYYYEGERGHISADQMLQVRWDTTISHWDILPEDSTTREGDGNPHWVQVTGVSQFSPFTLGGPGVLAVDLVCFNAVPGDGYITLNWSTASETGNKRWNLYRREGKEDKMIFSVRGQGTVPHPTEYQYNDILIVPDKTYHYKLAAVDENWDTTWYGPISATAEFEIFKAGFSSVYPNPFMQETVIKFTVNGSQFTGKNRQLLTVNCQLKIYDIAGRVVRTLVDERLKAGHHTVKFDGRNLASGVYFARLKVGDYRETRKIILLREN